MLAVINEQNTIMKTQKIFKEKMNDIADNSGIIHLGGKGWNKYKKVYWNQKLDIWWTMNEEPKSYVNTFGVGEPRWNKKYPHDIVCQINLPKEKNHKIAGLFAKDEKHKKYLLHSGRIGGGRKGIGKTLFKENFRGKWKKVWCDNLPINRALVGQLDSERFPQHVAVFVHDVKRIKNSIDCKNQDNMLHETIYSGFKDEFCGTKKYEIHETITSECDHGLIVNALEQKIKSKGLLTGNTKPMDLYIRNKNGKIEKLFEIKTDSTIGSCYKAIGQLLYRSKKLNAEPILIAVFPNTIDRESEAVLKKLGINVLKYRWIENQPHFIGFKKI